jgi:hypothetical protein
VTSQRIIELLLSAWRWLPVRGRVLVTVLALAQLYWVRWFFLAYIRAPVVLYRQSVMGRDTTRTLDPLYSEPIDPSLLHYLDDSERQLAALGFRDPHRTTNLTTYPLTVVGSSMEQPEHGDHVLVIGRRPPRDAPNGASVSSIAFDSEFVDGIRLVTSNVRALRYWPDARHVDHVRIAQVTDLAELYRLHRLRVDRRRVRFAQKKITRGRTPEQRLVFTKRRHLDFHKHLVRCRYRRRTSGGLRPTVRGAMFSAWRHVFPWRTIDQWWLRRRARAVTRLA